MDAENKKKGTPFLPRSYGQTGKPSDVDVPPAGPDETDSADVADRTQRDAEAGQVPLPEAKSDKPNARGPAAEDVSARRPEAGNETPPADPDEEPIEVSADQEPARYGHELEGLPQEAAPCPRHGSRPTGARLAEAVKRRESPNDSARRDHALYKVKVNITGIRFDYAGKVYYFDAEDLQLKSGDRVIVKTEKGMGMGVVVLTPMEREIDAALLESLRKVMRKATREDMDQEARCRNREAEAYTYCLNCIESLGLAMKLVSVECFFDQSKYVFYFTAEGRVDFRELVKQLVARFPVRIEMRQIGVRHEAKMLGGLACCGQELCCSRFLTDFQPVSVKMAKNQNLSLNPSKISGVCGRLMCCLAYEHEIYDEFKKGLPKVGKTVRTTHGQGVVLKHCALSETVLCQIDSETAIEVRKEDILGEAEAPGKKKQEKKASGEQRPNRKSRKKS